MREYLRKNADRINARRRELRNSNPDLFLARRKATEAKNPELYKAIKRRGHLKEMEKPDYREKLIQRIAACRKKYPETYHRIKQRFWEKAKSRPDIKLNAVMRAGIYHSLNGGKRGSWRTFVNYTLGELRAYLEALFLPGMTWKNQGLWHIDHIIPISWWLFRAPKDREFKQCWALANLRPLWGVENRRKGNR